MKSIPLKSGMCGLKKIVLTITLAPLLICCSAFTNATTTKTVPEKAPEYINFEEYAPKAAASAEALDLVRSEIIDFAKQYIGYRYGSVVAGSIFDCSGFAKYCFNSFGYDLDHSSASQAKFGKTISFKDAKMGDLVFFKENGRINHIAMVVTAGDNELYVIHSTNSRGIVIENIMDVDFWKARFAFVKDVLTNY